MKTLRSMMLGLALLVICGAAKANNTDDGKLTQSYAINTYVDAMVNGHLTGISDVLDQTAEFSYLKGKKLCSYNKSDMLEYLKENKDVKQVCTTNTAVVESNGKVAIVKVSMKYANFTRSNYVTMANTGAGWKITNVYSVFS